MKSFIEPLLPDCCYHIYNRGVNGINLFYQERNYTYFLQKVAKYLLPIADVYAYVLLRNHFHLLIRVHSAANIITAFPTKIHVAIPQIISAQFLSLFAGYALAINKQEGRTGNLFETPFLRKLVTSKDYFRQLVAYIHQNPQRHGFVTDYRDYAHSSYPAFATAQASRLQRGTVLDWFGGNEEFYAYHRQECMFGSPQFEQELAIELE